MNARPLRPSVPATVLGLGAVLLVATADLVHLLHVPSLLALGVGALVRRPRSG